MVERSDRWDCQHAAVIRAHDLPFALMNHPMMPTAEKCEVRKVGWPAIDPVNQVVRRSPGCRPVATRPDTPAVADLERLSLRTRDHPLGATNVDDHRIAVEQDPSHRAVPRQPLDRLR